MEHSGVFEGIISIFIVLVLYLLIFIYISIKIKLNKGLMTLLFFSILVRLTAAILNTYYFINFLPHSGADSVRFERIGYYLASGVLEIGSYSGDNYPLFIYLVYSVIGREPFIIIGINGILSVFASFFLYKSIMLLTNDVKKAILGMAIFLFFPHNIIFSSIILRESMIVFLVTLSLYMFVKYVQQKKFILIIFSLIFLSIASFLHAGVMFIILGYFYYLITEKGYSKKIHFLKKPIIIMLILTIVLGLFIFDDLFLRKFVGYDSVDSFVNRVESGTDNNGGSAYLQGYDVDSLQDVVLYSPLKVVYFFFSPLPWDIRNVNDIIAFILDVLIYFYLFKQLATKIRYLDWKDPNNKLFLSLIIGIIITSLVFALGTANAGTALRHRYKVLTLIILAVYTPVKSKVSKSRMRNRKKRV